MQIWIKYAVTFLQKGTPPFMQKGTLPFMQKGTLANTLSNVRRCWLAIRLCQVHLVPKDCRLLSHIKL